MDNQKKNRETNSPHYRGLYGFYSKRNSGSEKMAAFANLGIARSFRIADPVGRRILSAAGHLHRLLIFPFKSV